MLREATRPGWQAGGRAGETVTAADTSHSSAQPLALQVFKHDRWCTVGKLTCLDGVPILAIAHRNQHGVSTTVSVPLVVLDFAEKRNVRWFYFRRDTTCEMYRITLKGLRSIGIMQASGGVAELYVKIAQMHRCDWRKWPFAETVMRLETAAADVSGTAPTPTPAGQQLGLFSEVAS